MVQAAVDDGSRPQLHTEEARQTAELEREVRELRRANEEVRTASTCFATAGLDR